jgi:hypothetical protein
MDDTGSEQRVASLTRMYTRLSSMSPTERTANLQGRFDSLVEDDIAKSEEILFIGFLLRDAIYDECHPGNDDADEWIRPYMARSFDFMAQAFMNRPELLIDKVVAPQFVASMVNNWKTTPSVEDAKDFLSRLVTLCRKTDIAKHAATEIRHATMGLDELSEHFASLDAERRAHNDGTDENAPTRAKFIDSLVHSVTSRLGEDGQRFFMQLMPKIKKLDKDGVDRVMLVADRELFIVETEAVVRAAVTSVLHELRGKWLEDAHVLVDVDVHGILDADVFIALQYVDSDYSHEDHIATTRMVIDRLKDAETAKTIRSGSGIAPFNRKLSVAFTDAHPGSKIKHTFEI